MTRSSSCATSSSRSDMTRATMRTTRASSNWLNGRNSTRAAFGRMTRFVRRTIMPRGVSRGALIYCIQQRRRLPFPRFRRLLHATRPRFERLNLHERGQERERRFRAFVQVDPVDVQPVAAATGVGIVHAGVEVVLPQKPAESAASLFEPKPITGDAESLTASGHCRVCLERLLIEASAWLAAPIEAIRADWPEVTALGALSLDQRAQRLQADGSRAGVFRLVCRGHEHGLCEASVVVGGDVFEPIPTGRFDLLVETNEPPQELGLHRCRGAIPAQAPQILADA